MGVRNGKFYGTEFAISLWKPNVQVPNESSLAQTWLSSGEGTSLNTIESGWQVYPGMYGDDNPRLFVFWTANGYQRSGCYSLLCPGFVQTSNCIAGGASLSSMSQYDGDQYELDIHIWKDNENWWLKSGDDLIGYWPGKLFTSLGDGATAVEWGGEIVNYETDGKHTTTDMGSGHFGEEGFKKASYFRNLMIVDETNTKREPEGLFYSADNNGNCYNLKTGDGGTTFGSHFYFGGPGQNEDCP